MADVAGQILLLHLVEPKYPELGDCWELPGGGIDPGEDVFMAAQRELAEETGFVFQSLTSPLPDGSDL